MATIVQSETFNSEVLHSDQPVLVGFWAPWCGPCLAVAPTVDDVAAEYEGRAKVVKVNVDEAQDIATVLQLKTTE